MSNTGEFLKHDERTSRNGGPSNSFQQAVARIVAPASAAAPAREPGQPAAARRTTLQGVTPSRAASAPVASQAAAAVAATAATAQAAPRAVKAEVTVRATTAHVATRVATTQAPAM